jgi:hypothetical protein
MTVLDKFYIVLLLFCAIGSVVNKLAREEKLWVYFFIVFVSEFYIIVLKNHCEFTLYLYTGFFYNLFLIYYFIKNTKTLIIVLLVYLFSAIWVLNKGILFDNIDTISIVLLYLFLSLRYYFSQIKNPNEIPLYQKQHFWMATGIFVWSITYFFSVFPKFYFKENDLHFLQIVNSIFQYGNVFCYCLFLIGINSKYK